MRPSTDPAIPGIYDACSPDKGTDVVIAFAQFLRHNLSHAKEEAPLLDKGRAGFLHNRAIKVYKMIRVDAALSGAGTSEGLRIHVGPGFRRGLLSAHADQDASHHLPGGIEAAVPHHSSAYGRLEKTLRSGRWEPPKGWHTRGQTVSLQQLPPCWERRDSGLVVPLFETTRSDVARDSIHDLLVSAEPQPRDHNQKADVNEEGKYESQRIPALKEAFSEIISTVQAVAKGTTPEIQNGISLMAVQRFFSFFAECTKRVLSAKRDELARTKRLDKRPTLELTCDLLSDDAKLLAEQVMYAGGKDAAGYFEVAPTNKIAAEISKAERTGGSEVASAVSSRQTGTMDSSSSTGVRHSGSESPPSAGTSAKSTLASS